MKSLVGDLPPGWRDVELAEIAELRAGPTLHAEAGGPIKVIKPRDIIGGRLALPVDGIDEKSAAKLSRYQILSGDIVCVRTGTVGRQALATEEHSGCLYGTGIIRIRPGSHVDGHYLYYYLGHPVVKDLILLQARGTTIPSINTKALGALSVALPPLPVQQAVVRTLAALDEKVLIHQQISQTTAELREALLPFLLAGGSA